MVSLGWDKSFCAINSERLQLSVALYWRVFKMNNYPLICESTMTRIIKVKKRKENTQAKLLAPEVLTDSLGSMQWRNWSTVTKCMCLYMRRKHSLIQKYFLIIYCVPRTGLGPENIIAIMIRSLPSLTLQSDVSQNLIVYWSLLKKKNSLSPFSQVS